MGGNQDRKPNWSQLYDSFHGHDLRFLQTALLRDASALIRLSSYLLDTRPTTSSPIPFPGTPRATDLDILYKPVRRTKPLNAEDIALLRDLHADLVRICTRAQERGVTIIIDAEYRFVMFQDLSTTVRNTNQKSPVGINLLWTRSHYPSRANSISSLPEAKKIPRKSNPSYMGHTRRTSVGRLDYPPISLAFHTDHKPRTPSHLAAALADAKVDNYALGVKLVRGAYHPHELSAHAAPDKYCSISSDAEPPVWTSKSETDMCYNTCVKMLVNSIKADVDSRKGRNANSLPSVGMLFGTHNWDSCMLILDELVKYGLASKGPNEEDLVVLGDGVAERLTIGQLYG